MKSAEVEPLLRFAITRFQGAIADVDRLPADEYDSALHSARHHAHEAIFQLRLWARTNGIEIRDRMQT